MPILAEPLDLRFRRNSDPYLDGGTAPPSHSA